MRGDLAGWGRVTLTVPGFTLLLSRSTRKSSPRLSSSRDLRFLSDFPLEICIMYITARPFRKWETYLGTLLVPSSGTDFSLPVFLSVPVTSEITRFHLNYNRERYSDDPDRSGFN